MEDLELDFLDIAEDDMPEKWVLCFRYCRGYRAGGGKKSGIHRDESSAYSLYIANKKTNDGSKRPIDEVIELIDDYYSNGPCVNDRIGALYPHICIQDQTPCAKTDDRLTEYTLNGMVSLYYNTASGRKQIWFGTDDRCTEPHCPDIRRLIGMLLKSKAGKYITDIYAMDYTSFNGVRYYNIRPTQSKAEFSDQFAFSAEARYFTRGSVYDKYDDNVIEGEFVWPIDTEALIPPEYGIAVMGQKYEKPVLGSRLSSAVLPGAYAYSYNNFKITGSPLCLGSLSRKKTEMLLALNKYAPDLAKKVPASFPFEEIYVYLGRMTESECGSIFGVFAHIKTSPEPTPVCVLADDRIIFGEPGSREAYKYYKYNTPYPLNPDNCENPELTVVFEKTMFEPLYGCTDAGDFVKRLLCVLNQTYNNAFYRMIDELDFHKDSEENGLVNIYQTGERLSNGDIFKKYYADTEFLTGRLFYPDEIEGFTIDMLKEAFDRQDEDGDIMPCFTACCTAKTQPCAVKWKYIRTNGEEKQSIELKRNYFDDEGSVSYEIIYCHSGKQDTYPFSELEEYCPDESGSIKDDPPGADAEAAAALASKVFALKLDSTARLIKKYFNDLTFTEELTKKLSLMLRRYQNTKNIPNFAVAGETGTGKTTLVNGLARMFGKQGVIMLSASSLKGKYVGHTKNIVGEHIKQADSENKVLFIDEAYDIMDDTFGREAVNVLLPILSGDRSTVEVDEDSSLAQCEKTANANLEHKPVIWVGGYTCELRKMLSENSGLFRRFEMLQLDTPDADTLFEALLNLSDSQNGYLTEIYKENEELIKNHFAFGTRREYASFFANYAGMRRLHDEFVSLYRYDPDTFSPASASSALSEVIRQNENEIRTQRKNVLAYLNKDIFEVSDKAEVTLDDVIGCDEAKEYLYKLADMLSYPEKFENKGIRLPKGLLMSGAPGTGKTLLAKALAGEMHKIMANDRDKKIAFIFVSPNKLMSKTLVDSKKSSYVSNVELLFCEASKYDRCIIFIDEIDAIGRNRRHEGSNTDYLNDFLLQADGFEKRNSIFLIGATNTPERLDPALIRDGRFDKRISVPLPNAADRRETARYYLKKLSEFFETDAQLDETAQLIAAETESYSPSRIKTIVNESALLMETESEFAGKPFTAAVKRHLKKDDFTDKADFRKIPFSADVSNKFCTAAIHETGHALLSLILNMETPKCIRILQNDEFGGCTQLPRPTLPTKSHLENMLCVLSGGRIAEKMFFGDVSTSCTLDMLQATKIARDAVTKYGMSEKIGFMSLVSTEEYILSTDEKWLVSDNMRELAEKEIQNLLNTMYKKAEKILCDKKTLIYDLAAFLYQRVSLTGEEFKQKYNELVSAD